MLRSYEGMEVGTNRVFLRKLCNVYGETYTMNRCFSEPDSGEEKERGG